MKIHHINHNITARRMDNTTLQAVHELVGRIEELPVHELVEMQFNCEAAFLKLYDLRQAIDHKLTEMFKFQEVERGIQQWESIE